MLGFELTEQGRNRIAGPEDARVLEHQRGDPRRRRLPNAPSEGQPRDVRPSSPAASPPAPPTAKQPAILALQDRAAQRWRLFSVC